MIRHYILHYVGTKRSGKFGNKHRLVKTGFDIEAFASSKIEAVKLARSEIMYSIGYNAIESFVLTNVSVIE